MSQLRISLAPLTLLLSYIAACAAPASSLPALAGVGFEQRLDEQIPLDLEFVDETGKQIQLRDYFGQKPVILVLTQYRCPRLCTLVLSGLVQGMLETPFTVGKEFNVVTVSFDPREGPELAAAKKASYLRSYGRTGAEEGWSFLTGKPEAIRALTEAAGFRYKYDPERDQYIHASGIIILTPQGRIARYFYDVVYSGRDLRLGLVEASQNKIGSPVDQILLYCFHYDPSVGKYSASIMNGVRVSGVLTILALAAFFWFLRRCEPRTPKFRAEVEGIP
jgi:protein SCO1/2